MKGNENTLNIIIRPSEDSQQREEKQSREKKQLSPIAVQMFEILHFDWRNSTSRFALSPKRGNENNCCGSRTHNRRIYASLHLRICTTPHI